MKFEILETSSNKKYDKYYQINQLSNLQFHSSLCFLFCLENGLDKIVIFCTIANRMQSLSNNIVKQLPATKTFLKGIMFSDVLLLLEMHFSMHLNDKTNRN